VTRILLLLLCLFPAGQLLAETRYVTDQLEITMRKGESTRYKIARMLPSGTPVELLGTNEESGYAKVRTEDGTTGYVLIHQLMEEPPARDRVAELEKRLAELQQAPDKLAAQLSQLQAEHGALKTEYDAVADEKRRLEEELATIRHASANVVRITEERTELRQSVADLSRQLANLQQEHLDLKNQANQRWFLIGAGVAGAGILVGLVLPHVRFRRRKSSWGTL